MDREDYLGKFRTFPAFLERHKKTLEDSKRIVKTIEEQVKTLEEVQRAIRYLGSKAEEKDPGKNRPAYFFVSHMDDKDIIRSDRPSLFEEDPETRQPVPVIMRYRLEYDSPDVELWEKNAFIIVGNGTSIKNMKKVSSRHRFL